MHRILASTPRIFVGQRLPTSTTPRGTAQPTLNLRDDQVLAPLHSGNTFNGRGSRLNTKTNAQLKATTIITPKVNVGNDPEMHKKMLLQMQAEIEK